MTLKVWSEFIIPIALIVLIVSVAIIEGIVEQVKWNRKIKYLQKNGYERYLHNVASVGTKCWYGWKNELTNKRVLEIELKRISYKELKQMI